MLKFQKSTMIGLYACTELARAYPASLTNAELVKRFRASPHHLSKVLQQLARAGLVETTRGVGGGARLARDPGAVNLRQVVEVFEGPHGAHSPCLFAGARPRGPRLAVCDFHDVLTELTEQVVFTLESITLKTLVKPRRART